MQPVKKRLFLRPVLKYFEKFLKVLIHILQMADLRSAYGLMLTYAAEEMKNDVRDRARALHYGRGVKTRSGLLDQRKS